MVWIASFLLLALAMFFLGLHRAYTHVPIKELRRRARGGDEVATALYRAAVYGVSVRVLLLGLATGFSALLYFYMATILAPWLAVTVVFLLIWLLYIWLPMQRVHDTVQSVAVRLAPALSSVLHYMHPVIDRIHDLVRKHRPLHFHSGMYEIEDLTNLLERQRQQSDNRIPDSTIHTVLCALTFADKNIRDIYTPRRVVRAVRADETVGPILLAELHDSGFSRFPVYEDDPDEIVGILHLRDLLKKQRSGKIRSYMKQDVCFVHEEQSLRRGLDAILQTHQQLFVVVNSFEEYVGVVSIEDILEQVIGEHIVDEFDAYEDMRAVAQSQAADDRENRNHPAADDKNNK